MVFDGLSAGMVFDGLSAGMVFDGLGRAFGPTVRISAGRGARCRNFCMPLRKV
jgi:hypothetical protein